LKHQRRFKHSKSRIDSNRAKRNGTKSGKPISRPKIDREVETAIKSALSKGKGILAVAKSFGVGTGTVSRIAKDVR
jgi:DNA invertase Pin-like site-specific DNA recombinase